VKGLGKLVSGPGLAHFFFFSKPHGRGQGKHPLQIASGHRIAFDQANKESRYDAGLSITFSEWNSRLAML